MELGDVDITAGRELSKLCDTAAVVLCGTSA